MKEVNVLLLSAWFLNDLPTYYTASEKLQSPDFSELLNIRNKWRSNKKTKQKRLLNFDVRHV